MSAALHYRLREGVLAQTGLPEAVLLDSGSGEYFELNAVGTAILRLLLAGAPRSEWPERICLEFDAAHERAEADCGRFLAELVRRRLVEEAA